MWSGCCSDDGMAAVGDIFGPSQGINVWASIPAWAAAAQPGAALRPAAGIGVQNAGIGDIFSES